MARPFSKVLRDRVFAAIDDVGKMRPEASAASTDGFYWSPSLIRSKSAWISASLSGYCLLGSRLFLVARLMRTERRVSKSWIDGDAV